jgi:ribosomal protein S18 acetylase RimI-like enzyme
MSGLMTRNDAACGLYESIGFRPHTTVVGYSR